MKMIQSFGNDKIAANTWKKHQKEKQTIVKAKLFETTPILIEFLHRMMVSTDFISKLLKYPVNKQRTKEQDTAIKNYTINKEKWMKMKKNATTTREEDNDDRK
eukprot:398316_1